jgi:hypothetical protein
MTPFPSATRPTTLGPRAVAVAQGIFYLIWGLWPVLRLPSFESATGADDRRLHALGALVALVGGLLVFSARRGRPSVEAVVLGAGFALCLACVDLEFVFRGVVSFVYLLDAVIEAAFVIAWTAALSARGPARP